jgi:hypothetical protein
MKFIIKYVQKGAGPKDTSLDLILNIIKYIDFNHKFDFNELLMRNEKLENKIISNRYFRKIFINNVIQFHQLIIAKIMRLHDLFFFATIKKLYTYESIISDADDYDRQFNHMVHDVEQIKKKTDAFGRKITEKIIYENIDINSLTEDEFRVYRNFLKNTGYSNEKNLYENKGNVLVPEYKNNNKRLKTFIGILQNYLKSIYDLLHYLTNVNTDRYDNYLGIPKYHTLNPNKYSDLIQNTIGQFFTWKLNNRYPRNNNDRYTDPDVVDQIILPENEDDKFKKYKKFYYRLKMEFGDFLYKNNFDNELLTPLEENLSKLKNFLSDIHVLIPKLPLIHEEIIYNLRNNDYKLYDSEGNKIQNQNKKEIIKNIRNFQVYFFDSTEKMKDHIKKKNIL